MRDEVLHPAYLIVDYAWAVLKENIPNVWDEDKYGGLVPIVPLSEEPELDDFSGPHIVYGFADDATSDPPGLESGSTSFAIYDDNFRRLTKTVNCLKEAFNREDQSASDVNNYTDRQGNGMYKGVSFRNIGIAFIEGGTPETSEGGRQSALVTIRYQYVTYFDVRTNV